MRLHVYLESKILLNKQTAKIEIKANERKSISAPNCATIDLFEFYSNSNNRFYLNKADYGPIRCRIVG